jgi:long-subunit acyl-CoA synthetase (AMP-forming)
VESVNDKAISRVAQVKKWRIMDRDFSIDGGELTPTFKLKRCVISKLHADSIESLYSEAKL